MFRGVDITSVNGRLGSPYPAAPPTSLPTRLPRTSSCQPHEIHESTSYTRHPHIKRTRTQPRHHILSAGLFNMSGLEKALFNLKVSPFGLTGSYAESRFRELGSMKLIDNSSSPPNSWIGKLLKRVKTRRPKRTNSKRYVSGAKFELVLPYRPPHLPAWFSWSPPIGNSARSPRYRKDLRTKCNPKTEWKA